MNTFTKWYLKRLGKVLVWFVMGLAVFAVFLNEIKGLIQ